MLTILEGSTFCICDDRGDIGAETSGFFAHDTRFLSRLVLRVDGTRPLLLSSGRVEHFAAAFYLRNATANGLPHDALSIARERFVGTGMQERVRVRNESMERLDFELSLDARRRLRGHHLGQAPRLRARRPGARAPAAAAAPATPTTRTAAQLSIVDPRGDLDTRVVLSRDRHASTAAPSRSTSPSSRTSAGS